MSSPSLAQQTGTIGRRSVRRTLRRLEIVGPTLAFPLFWLALNSAALKNVVNIPHFPTKSYVTFALASTFVLLGMSTVSISGGAMAEDIRSGFLDRLRMTRLRPPALVFGYLAGAALMAVLAAILFIGIGLIAGANIKTGVGGTLVVLLLALLITLAFASLGVLAALIRPDAVQVVFPLLFVALFLSAQYLPRDLIEHGWFREVATYNPMTYFIEAPRTLLVSGWDAEVLALGGGLSLLCIVVAISLSCRRLEGKVQR